MTLNVFYRGNRTYIYGSIWQQPGGHDAVVDDAQIRTLQRELALLEEANREGAAA